MESRAFIRQATAMVERVEKSNIGAATIEEEKQKRDQIQKDLNQLFQGLQNPSLPSASKLAKQAQDNGFTVDAKVRNRIEQAESFWQ